MRIISSKRAIRTGLTVVLVAVVSLVLSVGSAGAITFGQPDGNLHPNVGALLADYDPDSPGPDILCSGTLIAPTVFLTAAHCTAFLEAEGIVRPDPSTLGVVGERGSHHESRSRPVQGHSK